MDEYVPMQFKRAVVWNEVSDKKKYVVQDKKWVILSNHKPTLFNNVSDETINKAYKKTKYYAMLRCIRNVIKAGHFLLDDLERNDADAFDADFFVFKEVARMLLRSVDGKGPPTVPDYPRIAKPINKSSINLRYNPDLLNTTIIDRSDDWDI